MDKYCRFCSEEKKNLLNINVLKDNIMEWLIKLVVIDETFPQKFCISCLDDIKLINCFVIKCNQSYEHLNNVALKLSEDHVIEDDLNSSQEQESEKDSLPEAVETEIFLETSNDKNTEFLEDQFEVISRLDNEHNNDEQSTLFLDIEESENLLKCQYCAEEFKSNKELNLHDCNTSTQPTKSNQKLNKNIKTSKYNFKCRFCEYLCNGRNKCAHHMKKEHFDSNENVFIAELEKIVISLNSSTEEIITDVQAIQNLLNLPEKFECNICKVRYKKKFALLSHQKIHRINPQLKGFNGNPEKYLCPDCGVISPSKRAFQNHRYKHNNKKIKCEQCSKTFTNNRLLASHMRTHTGNQPDKVHPCDICGKMLTNPSALRIHIRFHKNERPYKCDVCEKAFCVQVHLKDHMKIHTGIKDKICTICSKAYSTGSSLKKHYFEQHVPDDQKELECQFCGKKYGMACHLRDHFRKSHRSLAIKENLI